MDIFDGPSMATCLNEECKKLFVPAHGSSGKFCSKSCAAKVNNRKRRAQTHCLRLECTNRLEGNQKKFCSPTCQQVHQITEKIARWKTGEWNGSIASGELSALVRNYLLSQAGYECTECGWSTENPYIKKVILTVDHIDGNWKNNSPDNLKVICFNCHTLTPTFGSLNKSTAGPRSVGSRRH